MPDESVTPAAEPPSIGTPPPSTPDPGTATPPITEPVQATPSPEPVADAGDGAAPTTEPTPGEAPPEGEAPGEPSDVTDPVELDDETLDLITKAYKDRIVNHADVRAEIDRQARESADERLRERYRVNEVETEVQATITRGQQAVQGIVALSEAARAELTKAQNGEDFNAEVLNPQYMGQYLRDYGESIVAATGLSLDTAVEDGFDSLFQKTLPALTDTQAEQLASILNVQERMKGDQAQRDQARPFFFMALLHFAAQLGIEHGAAQELSKGTARSKVGERIASDNAVRAAIASISARKNPPAAPPNTPPATPSSKPLIEQYGDAKKANDLPEMDRVMKEMVAARQGVQFMTMS